MPSFSWQSCIGPSATTARGLLLQLTELGEHKSDSVRRIDELERACTSATKDAQQHEAQVSSLHRQLREAQVAVRNAEREADEVCPTAIDSFLSLWLCFVILRHMVSIRCIG
jgi:hypothetical protein